MPGPGTGSADDDVARASTAAPWLLPAAVAAPCGCADWYLRTSRGRRASGCRVAGAEAVKSGPLPVWRGPLAPSCCSATNSAYTVRPPLSMAAQAGVMDSWRCSSATRAAMLLMLARPAHAQLTPASANQRRKCALNGARSLGSGARARVRGPDNFATCRRFWALRDAPVFLLELLSLTDRFRPVTRCEVASLSPSACWWRCRWQGRQRLRQA